MNRPKGTKDIFGNKIIVKNYVKKIIFEIMQTYNFHEIETPIFEKMEIFSNTIGYTSDIVSKEMYQFEDKKKRLMALRPEGTVPVIRAIVENKLYNQAKPIKLFYFGPMFRYENPQKGRQRQFTQFGLEMFSEPSIFLDLEIILIAQTILNKLNIKTKLLINSLGDQKTKTKYFEILKNYFLKFKDQLSSKSISRIDKNPFRILDDKNEKQKLFVKNAPQIKDFYSNESKIYFQNFINLLKKFKIDFCVDNSLVRGLDYYTNVAFEFISTSNHSGSQNTLIGGGRYNDLLKNFGGPQISGIGFAVGIERIINELNEKKIIFSFKKNLEIFIINLSEKTTLQAMELVYQLRQKNYIVEWNYKPMNIKKAFIVSEKMNTKIQIIIGKKELDKNIIKVRYKKEEKNILWENIFIFIKKTLKEINEKT